MEWHQAVRNKREADAFKSPWTGIFLEGKKLQRAPLVFLGETGNPNFATGDIVAGSYDAKLKVLIGNKWETKATFDFEINSKNIGDFSAGNWIGIMLGKERSKLKPEDFTS